ncbi:MAG: ABC-2 transporter permease [Acutalibacteraceae bacterium]|nr:ABC-2 transporter permease [Acutalibacteraceae bacterium]
MKGFILKDLYMSFKHYILIYLFAMFFGISYIFNSETIYWYVAPVILASIRPIGILSLDERSKWILYSDTLPFSRKYMVSSKYILSLLSVLSTWLLIAIMRGISGLIIGNLVLIDFIATLSVVLALGLLTPALMLPVVFKYGTEKGRIVYYIVAFLLVALGTSLGLVADEIGMVNKVGQYVLQFSIIAVIVIAIFICSWMLSINIYKNRELN